MAKNYIQEQSEQEQDLDIKAMFLSDAIQSSLFDTIGYPLKPGQNQVLVAVS